MKTTSCLLRFPPCALALTAIILFLLLPCANASTLYEFSLPENGEAGVFRVSLLINEPLPLDELVVFELADDAVISYESGAPIIDFSLIGIEVQADRTLFGIALFSSDPGSGIVQVTDIFPDDFFEFNRGAGELGSFQSVAGNVTGDLDLDTANPVATLSVSDVPEPAVWMLLSAGLLGLGMRRLRQGR